MNRSMTVFVLLATATVSACKQNASEPAMSTSSAQVSEVIKSREANFKEISKANKAVKASIESGTPDLATIATAASTITSKAKKIEGFFPAGTGPASGQKTEALEVIWAKPAEFAKATGKLIATSADLAEAAKGNDVSKVKAAASKMSATCKGCHDIFRQEKP